MISIYDYTDSQVKEITEAQYDFIQMLIKHSGRMDSLLKEYPVPQEELDKWRADPVFWPILNGYIMVIVKSRGLSIDKVKEFLLDVIVGFKEPSKMQMMAVNAALKALGAGVIVRPGFSGKVTVTPENTEVVFNDGLEQNTNQDKPV